MMNRLSHYFINGLIVLVPIVITYFVIATVFALVEGIVESYIPLKFPGAGVALLIIVILVAGWITSTWTWASQRIISYFETVVDKIPVVKFIYNSVKRVSTMLFESKTMFSQVVLIPYPHPNVKTIGFLMPKPSSLLAPYLSKDEEYESVFLPWSLNMTSGFNVFVPKKDAFQYILTAGGVMPGADVKADLAKIQEVKEKMEKAQQEKNMDSVENK